MFESLLESGRAATPARRWAPFGVALILHASAVAGIVLADRHIAPRAAEPPAPAAYLRFAPPAALGPPAPAALAGIGGEAGVAEHGPARAPATPAPVFMAGDPADRDMEPAEVEDAGGSGLVIAAESAAGVAIENLPAETVSVRARDVPDGMRAGTDPIAGAAGGSESWGAAPMLSDGRRAGRPGGVPGGASSGVPGGALDGVPGGVLGGVPGGVFGGVPWGVPWGVPGGVPGGIPGGVPGGSLAAGSPARPLPVGGDVSAPLVIGRVLPEYPWPARSARVEGAVELEAVILRDGSVGEVRVIRGLPMGCTEAAIAALRRWSFRPGERRGVPIAVFFTLSVDFKLTD